MRAVRIEQVEVERVRDAVAAGAALDRIVWYEIDSDDVWARDHGPIFVLARDDAPPGTLVALHQHGQRLTLKTGIATEKLLNLELIPLSRV